MKEITTRNVSFEEMKDDLPKEVFKYRKWSDKFHQKAISERQLFYAAPSTFDDPLDCKADVRYDKLSFRQKLTWIEYKLRQYEPGKTDSYYRRKAPIQLKQSELSSSSKIRKFQEFIFHEADVRTGVLCLTPNSKNEEMWNKYSEDHKGFCLGYNPIILFEQLGGGGKVQYVDELPIVLPEPFTTFPEQVFTRIFFKEKKWSFEDEYRTHTFRPNALSIEDRIIDVNPQAFTKIIIGKEMNNEDRKSLIELIPDELKHVKVINEKDYH